jgi:hypothetical protein
LVGAAMCSASISAVHVTAGHNALRVPATTRNCENYQVTTGVSHN